MLEEVCEDKVTLNHESEPHIKARLGNHGLCEFPSAEVYGAGGQ